MKPLENAVILYDADCPLCRAYTGAFVRWKFLKPDGRAPFQTAHETALTGLDCFRAQDEIALLDTNNGRVRYGLDSLFHILGHRFPAVPRIGNWPPVRWMLTKLYRFISYNRKVIAAVQPGEGARNCQPAFNLKYRLAYLLLAWAVVALILARYSNLLSGLIPTGGFAREGLIAGGQLLFQGVIAAAVARKKFWDYLGHLMTVSLIGALLLLPVLVLSTWIGQAPYAYTGFFLAVATFMLWEHTRRVKLLGITPWMSATWVLYRALVLLVVLQY